MLDNAGRYTPLSSKAKRHKHEKPTTSLLKSVFPETEKGPQLVAASATLGRPAKRYLEKLSSRALPMYRSKLMQDFVGASSGENTSRESIDRIPSSIVHQYFPTRSDSLQDRLRSVSAALHQLTPRSLLLVVPKGLSVLSTVKALQKDGFTNARPVLRVESPTVGILRVQEHKGLQQVFEKGMKHG